MPEKKKKISFLDAIGVPNYGAGEEDEGFSVVPAQIKPTETPKKQAVMNDKLRDIINIQPTSQSKIPAAIARPAPLAAKRQVAPAVKRPVAEALKAPVAPQLKAGSMPSWLSEGVYKDKEQPQAGLGKLFPRWLDDGVYKDIEGETPTPKVAAPMAAPDNEPVLPDGRNDAQKVAEDARIIGQSASGASVPFGESMKEIGDKIIDYQGSLEPSYAKAGKATAIGGFLESMQKRPQTAPEILTGTKPVEMGLSAEQFAAPTKMRALGRKEDYSNLLEEYKATTSGKVSSQSLEAARLAAGLLQGRNKTQAEIDREALDVTNKTAAAAQKVKDDAAAAKKAFEYDSELERLKQKGKAVGIAAKPSAGSVQRNKNFGKTINEFVDAGGYTGVAADLKKLDVVIDKLEKDKEGHLTGQFKGYLGTPVRSLFNRDSSAAQNEASNVLFKSLKTTFPGAVSDDERKALVSSTYDPQQNPQEVARRLRQLRDQILAGAKAKQAAVDYYNKNNQSLDGYTGPDEFSSKPSVDYLTSGGSTQATTPSPAKITVHNAKTGETFRIDPSDLKDAIKDGFVKQ